MGKNIKYKYTEDDYRQITEDNGYVYVGNHRNTHSQLYIEFICPKHLKKGVQNILLAQMRHKRVCCGACNGTNRTTEEFAEMMGRVLPNVRVIGEYIGARHRIRVKCDVCGHEWEPFAYNLLSGYGCKQCSRKSAGDQRYIPEEEKLKRLIALHPDIEFSDIPRLARSNVHCKCKACGREWNATFDNLTKEKHTGCPGCAGANTENRIASLLKDWGVPFIRQYSFEGNLRDVKPLPCDFYLPKHRIVIEYDGEQHFSPIPFCHATEEQAYEMYLTTVRHDAMKDAFCKSNNVAMIRIPFTQSHDLEYQLFDALVKHGVLEEIASA